VDLKTQTLAIAKTDPNKLWLQRADWSFTDKWPEAWTTQDLIKAKDRLSEIELASELADSDEEYTVVILTFTKDDDNLTLERAQAVDIRT
jgi:hypothetical protein